MLKNNIIDKKMVIIGILGLILVFLVAFILGYTNASNNKEKNIENKQTVSETKEIGNKQSVSKEETVKEEKEDIKENKKSGDWIEYKPSSYDIILRNNEIELSSEEEAYTNLTPVEDDYNTDRRFIIPEIDASIKIPKDYYIGYNKNDNGAVTYRLEPSDNSNGYIELVAVPANIRDGKDIYDIAKYLYEENYVEINQYLKWKYFKINNSHIGMYYHRPADNRTFAIIRDANGNLISIGASNVDDWTVFDMLVNYESFSTAGFRYIDQKDRNKIYIDRINSVSMK